MAYYAVAKAVCVVDCDTTRERPGEVIVYWDVCRDVCRDVSTEMRQIGYITRECH